MVTRWRQIPPPILDLPGPHRRRRTRAIGFGLLAETLVIAGVAVSAYLVGQALSGATVAELWPWIIALTIVVPAIAACQQLDVHYAHKSSFRSHEDIRHLELYPSHHVPNRVVAAAIPSLAAVGLFVIHPLLGLALLPFFLLVSSVPRWLRTRACAQGQEILDTTAGRLTRARVAHGRRVGFENGLTDGLIGLGLLVVVGVAALLVSRGELSAGGYLAAVVLTVAAFLRLSRPDTDHG